MSVKTFTRSFAGGEVSPALFGRLDLAKFQTGLSKCLNFIVTPQGPIENRPGFEYILRAKDTATPPVLIPFTYNAQQSFALEFGNGYIRFHTQGGTLLESGKAITGVTQAAPGVFTCAAHGFAVGNWVFLSGIGGMTALNGRWGIVATVPDANHFTLTDLFGVAISTAALPAYTAGGAAARVYEIASPYAAADLLDLHYVQSADVLTITHQNYSVRELRRLGATNWTLTVVTFAPGIGTPLAPLVATGGPGGGTPVDVVYAATAVMAGTLEESLASPTTTVTLDLAVVGNYTDVQPSSIGGAVRYNIYKQQGGVFGYIGQSDGSPLRDTNITPDMSKTPPLTNSPFASESPRAVSYFEQRRCFGGGNNNPQTLWQTRSGTESNLTYSIPTQDDDAITARIVAREANTVRHLVPLGDLLALTSGGVWKISSSDTGPITPATFSVKPQSYVGASNVQPVVTSYSVVYVQDRGSHLREVAYKWDAQSYVAADLSVLAPHLFDFYTVKQLAASTAPYTVLWGVRDDGQLLGLTYQPEHEVKALHQHSTDGAFMSVCGIPEGVDDGVYVVAQRNVQGQDWYYIERMHTRQFTELADAFFVDCGLTYEGTEAMTITGLWHLEGKSVTILADGGVHPPRTVTNGAVALQAAASKVHVGLPYNCDAATMPLAVEAVAALGQGILKNVNEVMLRVYQSSGIKAGPSFSQLTEYPQRTTTDDLGAPPGMVTGIVQMKLTPSWQRDGLVCVRQANPLPLTLLAATIEAATGG